MSSKNNNIENIDGSKRYRGKRVHKPKKSVVSRFGAGHIITLILIFIAAYLGINLYMFEHRNNGATYEVQAEKLSKETVYKGIAVRKEALVSSQASGYVNYYVRNGKKAAKNSIVYSLDMGNSVHERLSRSFEDIKLDSEEIRQIKSLISEYRSDYSGSDMSASERFERELNSNVTDFVNENMLYGMESTIDEIENGSSYISLVRTPISGIISYKTDILCGVTADQISRSYYEKDYDCPEKSLKQSEIVVAGEPIYRLCDSESWEIVVLVDEQFFLDHLEDESIGFFVNGSSAKISAGLELIQKEKDYYAILSLSDRMSSYIDDRFLNIEFDSSEDMGLKIPVSSVTEKGFYLVPKSCFVYSAEKGGNVLMKVSGTDTNGYTAYEEIYFPRYYSDDYYAYIDMDSLSEGDRLFENGTDETYTVRLVNYLEGVYCVNRGYYQFIAIDRLKSNSEYVIVRSDSKEGIRRYDRIALYADRCREGQLIDR